MFRPNNVIRPYDSTRRLRSPQVGDDDNWSEMPLMKRDTWVIYSAVKPPMKMLLWNTQTLKHLHRELHRWLLDEEFQNGKTIRKIERLVEERGPDGEVTRSWRKVHNNACCLLMMAPKKEITLMVVIVLML